MERPTHRIDRDGFPIPATFDDNTRGPTPPEQPRTLSKGWMLLLILAPLGIALLLGGVFGGGAWTQMLMQSALTKYQEGDTPGALAELDRAAYWTKKLPPEFYQLRGAIRMDAGDLEGAEADCNELVKQSPDDAAAYTLRSQVYQRESFRNDGRNRHAAAIADLGQAVRLSSNDDPMPKNNRAYARALAGIELKEGLSDAEQSIELLDKHAKNPLIPGSAERSIQLARSRAMVLDTRGYLHHLLGNQEQALADLNEAIKLSVESEKGTFELQKVQDAAPKLKERLRKQFQEPLSVLHHHRALIHEKMGHVEEASADREQAKTLGYDPANGIF